MPAQNHFSEAQVVYVVIISRTFQIIFYFTVGEVPSKPTSSCRIEQIKNGYMYLSNKYPEKISEFPVSVPVGSKLFVRCELGFELTGKSSFKCRSKGRAGPPKCRRKKRTIGTNESEA